MERPVISLGMQNKMIHIMVGVCYTAMGIMEMLRMQIPYCEEIKCVLIVIATICLFAYILSKREKHDEMSWAYTTEAGTFGFQCVVMAACCFLILDVFFKEAITLRAAVPIIAGVGFLAMGVKFYRLEKDGDE